MHRQLLRQEPEVIAVIARTEAVFKQWQREHDFYDMPNIKWRYIRGEYSIIGIKFTMIFLIEDFWRTPQFGKLTRLLHRNMNQYGFGKHRTFSTLEGVKHNFERRS